MPIPNDGKHVENIVNTTACGRHDAGTGVACWGIETNVIETDYSERYAFAVCGQRIAKAGFNGKISPQSMRKTSTSSGGRSVWNKSAPAVAR